MNGENPPGMPTRPAEGIPPPGQGPWERDARPLRQEEALSRSIVQRAQDRSAFVKWTFGGSFLFFSAAAVGDILGYSAAADRMEWTGVLYLAVSFLGCTVGSKNLARMVGDAVKKSFDRKG